MPSTRPPEPWDSFLKDLDAAVDAPVRLDCIGGFVVTQLYGLDRHSVARSARWSALSEASDLS